MGADSPSNAQSFHALCGCGRRHRTTHDAEELERIMTFLMQHYPQELLRHRRETTADVVIRLLSTGVR